MATKQQFEDHEALLTLYRYAEQYKELLYTVDSLKYNGLEKLLKDIARNHVIDRVLVS